MKKILILLFLLLFSFFVSKKDTKSQIDSLSKNIIYMELSNTKDIVELEFEEYLKGVLYAEMPSSFNIEALKAQAVAARTYTVKKLSTSNHICDNPSHCQAWKDPSTSPDYEKLSEAVNKTKNENITYLGEPIEAFFHSSSGGKTENSENVWVNKKPYLISVDSPGEEKIMSSFYSNVEFTYKELKDRINSYKNKKLITDTTNLKNKIKILSLTEGNRVKDIKIQDSIFSGTEIRSILGLRSANFTITLNKNAIIFNVVGYGHGVGMSQWGAEVMAQNGSNYKEILSHYYPGTMIQNTNKL